MHAAMHLPTTHCSRIFSALCERDDRDVRDNSSSSAVLSTLNVAALSGAHESAAATPPSWSQRQQWRRCAHAMGVCITAVAVQPRAQHNAFYGTCIAWRYRRYVLRRQRRQCSERGASLQLLHALAEQRHA